jgi:hypothetical protein
MIKVHLDRAVDKAGEISQMHNNKNTARQGKTVNSVR